jgi:uncharacterized protein (DUF433 family)
MLAFLSSHPRNPDGNWADCPIIEQVPGKMSGAPVLRHSRMRPQGIISNREMGAE